MGLSDLQKPHEYKFLGNHLGHLLQKVPFLLAHQQKTEQFYLECVAVLFANLVH